MSVLSIASGGITQAVNPATSNPNSLNIANFQADSSGNIYVMGSAVTGLSNGAIANLQAFYGLFNKYLYIWNSSSGDCIKPPNSANGAVTMSSSATGCQWDFYLDSDNVYRLISQTNGPFVIDGGSSLGATVEGKALSDTGASQHWITVPVDDYGFKIVNPATGYCLEQSGSGVITATYTGASTQIWAFTDDASAPSNY